MITKTFILAGKAIFTVQPSADFLADDKHKGCRPHYTYRVERVEQSATNLWPTSWFVSVLVGSDHDYLYLGKLNEKTGDVKITPKSAIAEGSWSVRVLRRVLSRIWVDEPEAIEAHGWKVEHAGKCGRCSRVLTTPESIERGLGPDCAELLGVA